MASLQEELAAAKLREAEAHLALKELRAKVAELSAMWQKHLKRGENATVNGNGDESSETPPPSVSIMPSTPKKLLGSLLDPMGSNAKSEAARLEDELMTSRLIEVEGQAQLKEMSLKVMELETQVKNKHYYFIYSLINL